MEAWEKTPKISSHTDTPLKKKTHSTVLGYRPHTHAHTHTEPEPWCPPNGRPCEVFTQKRASSRVLWQFDWKHWCWTLSVKRPLTVDNIISRHQHVEHQAWDQNLLLSFVLQGTFTPLHTHSNWYHSCYFSFITAKKRSVATMLVNWRLDEPNL